MKLVSHLSTDPIPKHVPNLLRYFSNYYVLMEIPVARIIWIYEKVFSRSISNQLTSEEISTINNALNFLRQKYRCYINHYNFSFEIHNGETFTTDLNTSRLFDKFSDIIKLIQSDDDLAADDFFVGIASTEPTYTKRYISRVLDYLQQSTQTDHSICSDICIWRIYWITLYYIHNCMLLKRQSSLFIKCWCYFPAYVSNVLNAQQDCVFERINESVIASLTSTLKVPTKSVPYCFWLWSILDYLKITFDEVQRIFERMPLTKRLQLKISNKETKECKIIIDHFTAFLRCLRDGNVPQLIEHMFEEFAADNPNPLVIQYILEVLFSSDAIALKRVDEICNDEKQSYSLRFSACETEFQLPVNYNTIPISEKRKLIIKYIVTKLGIVLSAACFSKMKNISKDIEKKEFRQRLREYKKCLLQAVECALKTLEALYTQIVEASSQSMQQNGQQSCPLSIEQTLFILENNQYSIFELVANAGNIFIACNNIEERNSNENDNVAALLQKHSQSRKRRIH